MGQRVNKSLKNTLFGMVGLFCSLIVSFVSRSIFISILGVEYNGVNGLFSNILNVLSLAELGFASSIAYALYKPLAENDEKSTAVLMHYFAKIYRTIAVVVGLAGCCCIPFLQYLISEDISELSFTLTELRIYFGMYLANTVCSYLLAYKRTIITADQNSYIISNIDNICNILLNILQIILLYITRNFYAYLIIMICKTIINNLIIHIIASKKYSYLSQYREDKISKATRSDIFKNVQAMFMHNVGSVIVYGTTSIVISTFVSLIEAGMYSNYTMIVTNVNQFINIIFNSATASIGNLCLSEDKQHQYIVFKRIRYLSNFCAVFAFICYVCLFNDFIGLWIGEDMQFGLNIVIAISLNSMIGYLRKTAITFKNAMGLFRQDWYKSILGAICGIAVAIGLSYVWGTFGVIVGYTSGVILFEIPIENFVLFKYGLKRSVIPHTLNIICMAIFACISATVCYLICYFIPDGLGWFILEFIFVVIFAAGVYLVLTFKTEEFKYYINLVKSIMSKIWNKLKNRRKNEN